MPRRPAYDNGSLALSVPRRQEKLLVNPTINRVINPASATGSEKSERYVETGSEKTEQP